MHKQAKNKTNETLQKTNLKISVVKHGVKIQLWPLVRSYRETLRRNRYLSTFLRYIGLEYWFKILIKVFSDMLSVFVLANSNEAFVSLIISFVFHFRAECLNRIKAVKDFKFHLSEKGLHLTVPVKGSWQLSTYLL